VLARFTVEAQKYLFLQALAKKKRF
jgi:hypothetical protein